MKNFNKNNKKLVVEKLNGILAILKVKTTKDPVLCCRKVLEIIGNEKNESFDEIKEKIDKTVNFLTFS